MELIPDPTTEGGRRVLFVHIDGDGSNPSALQSLIDRIFEIYRVPHPYLLVEGGSFYLSKV